MFTGIIETIGEVISTTDTSVNKKITINPQKHGFLHDVRTGDSISVNGACMTVEQNDADKFYFTAIHETLQKTNLGLLSTGNKVNLEKAMKPEKRIDGHFVQGHIDTTGEVMNINNLGGTWEFFISFKSSFSDNVIYVGSIAVNGISLTVADIVDDNNEKTIIKIAVIPHTFENTNMKFLKPNSIVNIEFDMLGKYVKRIIQK
ncbi:MAG: riboflavin synthase [Ignavibacteria bacterium]|nr:MAG: riboflavin synthase [Chlorobiota bacterium]MBV6398915.1 Riboflavin synthase [Ignavibacteria bacterium]MCC6886246.1 riboflavin synthase [Ignavibacteriales bacterium]MCE7952300.1 riboflavin synthase [Chlorobi bacterium CHB7]RIK48558.1 MAG: riboflavin synthase [Ignavibacteriota bacterium]